LVGQHGLVLSYKLITEGYLLFLRFTHEGFLVGLALGLQATDLKGELGLQVIVLPLCILSRKRVLVVLPLLQGRDLHLVLCLSRCKLRLVDFPNFLVFFL
jgi:hypothetical protein